jgi:2-oxoglutarate ferredoxin oxidoreductase subunit gamma
MRKEIRVAGFGGQGVVLGGTILGKALALYDDYEVVLTQVYGPEARGGASSSSLVISDELIDYPFVQHPDFLIILSQEAYTKFRPEASQDAAILIDEGLVTPWDDDHPNCIPATRLAEEMGQRRVANVIMLGFFTALTGLASRQAMEKAIETTVKAKTVPVNLRAFAAGYEYAVQGEHKG